MLILTVATLALAAEPGPPRWRVALGAQIDADPHGIADLGWRHGPWSVELLTDTIDARWAPSSDRGRAWVAVRLQPYAGQMLISPWVDGEPAPEDALIGMQAGPEGGAIRYLPQGWYVGGQGAVRAWAFARRGEASTATVPPPLPVGTADAIVGWWSPVADLWTRTGVDVTPDRVAPHATARMEIRPRWTVAPYALLHGVVAANQDILLTTRVGGMNPYVVPVAGAAWAEWWVEDLAAVRVGPRWQPAWGHLGVVADAVWLPDPTVPDLVAGAAAVGRWTRDAWSVDVAVGYAPWIPRAAGVGRTSVSLLIGRAWYPPEEG